MRVEDAFEGKGEKFMIGGFEEGDGFGGGDGDGGNDDDEEEGDDEGF